MEIKGQMADFLCGAGIETLKLRLAEGEILKVEKCGPQSNPGEPKANAETNEVSGVLGEWGEGKCGWSMWHAGSNGRRCCWKSSWGHSVQGHRHSAKGLGVYPASNEDPAEVLAGQ